MVHMAYAWESGVYHGDTLRDHMLITHGSHAGLASTEWRRLALQLNRRSFRRRLTTRCSRQGCPWTCRSARPPTSSAPLRATRQALAAEIRVILQHVWAWADV